MASLTLGCVSPVSMGAATAGALPPLLPSFFLPLPFFSSCPSAHFVPPSLPAPSSSAPVVFFHAIAQIEYENEEGKIVYRNQNNGIVTQVKPPDFDALAPANAKITVNKGAPWQPLQVSSPHPLP